MHPRHQPALHVHASSGNRRWEHHPPQVRMHVIDQANLWRRSPERSEKWHSIADLNNEVTVSQVSPISDRRTSKLAVPAAISYDTVRALGRRPATEQADVIATGRHPSCQPINENF